MLRVIDDPPGLGLKRKSKQFTLNWNDRLERQWLKSQHMAPSPLNLIPDPRRAAD